ncbi:MAG: S9 family peptidase [Flavobacteriales bacterium]|nr:S9 family peptidase [Flavobacteriales bacterium]
MSFLAVTTLSFGQKKDFTLDEIWSGGKFRAKSVYGIRSLSSGKHYTSIQSLDGGRKAILKYEYASGKVVDTILSTDQLKYDGKTLELSSYTFSKDETKLLIPTESESIYRYSTKEHNFIYNTKDQSVTPLSDGAKQRYATFSPQANKVAFVRENNIFIKDLSNKKEIRITQDGLFNQIINGATDWVYEEEFAFDKAFFWSADGKKIAYYKFDESKVKEFNMAKYGKLYPEDYRFKYPKAGEENAKVSIHIYDLEKASTLNVELSQTFEYIPRIKWTNDPNLLTIQIMNRHQSQLDLLLVNATSGSIKPILTEKSDTYVEVGDYLTFVPNSSDFVWSSERSGYNHLYLYNLEGKIVKTLTEGSYDVTDFYGLDDSGTLYYQAAEDSPLGRQIYKLEIKSSKKTKLTSGKGTHSAKFSQSKEYFIDNYSAANQIPQTILLNSKGKEVRVLESNAKLKATMDEYKTSNLEFMTIPNTEGGVLNAWMIKPDNFDANKKYPVLMYVYGGPGSQTVKNSWGYSNYLWYQYLAQQGYIVVSVDNRGTGARGAKFKKITYKQMGKYESQDQIDAAKYLAKQNYVDAKRIGIWGWSYGGYMSSLCLFKAADVFSTAIAVAPVTNWRYYDTIYTERYMQTPQENGKGYDDNSPINHVEKLEGKFLLVHGTADDNVHYQNSIEMVDALVKAGKQFDSFFYPDKNHSIYGGNTRLHLYTMMTNFLVENL